MPAPVVAPVVAPVLTSIGSRIAAQLFKTLLRKVDTIAAGGALVGSGIEAVLTDEETRAI